MGRWIGLGLLALVVVGSIGYSLWTDGAPEEAKVSIFYGGEKSSFLASDAFEDILRRHGVILDARRAGSVEMSTSLDVTGVDCLWPSNEVAVALARQSGKTVLSDRNVFNSPIVFYARADVADAFVAKGVAQPRRDGFLGVDVAALAGLIERGARWKEDFGLDNIYGRVLVRSTHPAKSNSGNIWSALLATAFNDGETPTQGDMQALTPKLAAYFEAMGYMEDSSGDIFENFIKQAGAAHPVIVGYENQLIEFLIRNADKADLIRARIRVLYPAPTIYASHPLISLTPRCGRLLEALEDPDAQDLAWRAHGFRTGLIGVENDPDDIAVAKLPGEVGLVAPMPSPSVMRTVIDTVR